LISNQTEQAVSEDGITAVATEDGVILLTMVDGESRLQVELSIEAAEELKAQVGSALITARIRARR
jgi:hypothetical protein